MVHYISNQGDCNLYFRQGLNRGLLLFLCIVFVDFTYDSANLVKGWEYLGLSYFHEMPFFFNRLK